MLFLLETTRKKFYNAKTNYYYYYLFIYIYLFNLSQQKHLLITSTHYFITENKLSHVTCNLRKLRHLKMIASQQYFSIEESKRVSLYKKAKLTKKFFNLKLVGRSRQFNSDCASFSKEYICECKKTTKTISHSCNKFSCPECYQKASYK